MLEVQTYAGRTDAATSPLKIWFPSFKTGLFTTDNMKQTMTFIKDSFITKLEQFITYQHTIHNRRPFSL